MGGTYNETSCIVIELLWCPVFLPLCAPFCFCFASLKMVRLSLDDPFALALAPPPNETAAEKETRERAEAEARSVSDVIDEQIRQERIALKKKKSVKVLLL